MQERSRTLSRYADLVEKHTEELAALETWNNGKPYEQAAQVEVPNVVRLLGYYAGETNKQTRRDQVTMIGRTLFNEIQIDCYKIAMKFTQVGQIRSMG